MHCIRPGAQVSLCIRNAGRARADGNVARVVGLDFLFHNGCSRLSAYSYAHPAPGSPTVVFTSLVFAQGRRRRRRWEHQRRSFTSSPPGAWPRFLYLFSRSLWRRSASLGPAGRLDLIKLAGPNRTSESGSLGGGRCRVVVLLLLAFGRRRFSPPNRSNGERPKSFLFFLFFLQCWGWKKNARRPSF